MESHSLSLGAHLLLWVFPTALVIVVFVENHPRRTGEGPQVMTAV